MGIVPPNPLFVFSVLFARGLSSVAVAAVRLSLPARFSRTPTEERALGSSAINTWNWWSAVQNLLSVIFARSELVQGYGVYQHVLPALPAFTCDIGCRM